MNPGELMIETSVPLSRVWAACFPNQSLQLSRFLEVTGAVGMLFQSAEAGVGTVLGSGPFVDSGAVRSPVCEEIWPAGTAMDRT